MIGPLKKVFSLSSVYRCEDQAVDVYSPQLKMSEKYPSYFIHSLKFSFLSDHIDPAESFEYDSSFHIGDAIDFCLAAGGGGE